MILVEDTSRNVAVMVKPGRTVAETARAAGIALGYHPDRIYTLAEKGSILKPEDAPPKRGRYELVDLGSSISTEGTP